MGFFVASTRSRSTLLLRLSSASAWPWPWPWAWAWAWSSPLASGAAASGAADGVVFFPAADASFLDLSRKKGGKVGFTDVEATTPLGFSTTGAIGVGVGLGVGVVGFGVGVVGGGGGVVGLFLDSSRKNIGRVGFKLLMDATGSCCSFSWCSSLS